MKVKELESIKIKLASPEEILSWSQGEVIKAETINYRTQRPEKDGLFCERIFGPVRDYQCSCGKYKGIRYKGIICDRCGVEVTNSTIRRERMGHIKLAVPVSHIWFLRGIPSRMGLVLDIPANQLERVIYFAAYIITELDKEQKKKILEDIEKEFKEKAKSEKLKKSSKIYSELKETREMAKKEVTSLKPLKILSEEEYREFSLKYGECFEAGTGAESLRQVFKKINFKTKIRKLEKDLEEASIGAKRKILRRFRLLKSMERAKIRPEWMFLTTLPILPPDLRPMVQLDGGRYASSDLNDLYRRVINRNNRLKYLIEIGAPEVILRNEKRMLQEAVDALIDNGMRKGVMTQATTGGRRLLKSLADMLKGKQGRFRQNLLGKRVDYSGRSVIVVGPELKFDEVGIPKKMALELFKPFVIRKILEKELAFNVRGATRVIEEEKDEVWAILEEIVRDKVILINRAPTLHRLSIQAFRPVLIEGEAIRIHPMICRAFNADFDGDQMAIFLPLSEMAQREAKERMLSSLNFLKPANGNPVVTLYQDIVLGCYWLTRIVEGKKGEGKLFTSQEEAILACELDHLDIKAKIKVRIKGKIIETSVGRLLFNQSLPDKYPFQNQLIKIKILEKIVGELIEKYSREIVAETLDKIKELGFEYSTLSGLTWGIDDLVIPKEKEDIIEKAKKEAEEVEEHFRKGLLSREEKSSKLIQIWSKAKGEIEKIVPETLPKTGPVYQITDAGARGSWSQPIQMTGMKGLVVNPAGQIIELPVISSYKEGFEVLEYFISTHGARKGAADTALRTSTAGYLTRRLIDVSHSSIIFEPDCKDKKGIEILKSDADEIGQDFLQKIIGRYILKDLINPKSKKTIAKKDEIIDYEIGKKIIKAGIQKIKVRSPLSCKSKRGICQKCYGWDLGRNEVVKIGEAVGIVAAQSIGEPGTQLTLRTFHLGGVAGGGDITQGLLRVEEIFETTKPGGKAEISPIDGKIIDVTPEKIIKIKSKEKKEILEFKANPLAAVWVKPGQKVKKGDQLFEGSLDLKELFRLVDKEDAQRYIIKEVQKIYASQGAEIHDKHIEVIVREMFSRLRIKDSGDSIFLTGQVVEKGEFLEENERLKKEKKKPAKATQLLLGITKAALSSKSFLSAASFQETSRVLIKAALEGKEDELEGLKENVIIGKLIPCGTGLK
ncbi:DNA-directed RNA polymerase subunit beta' [Parcubacteria bacterium DG_74_2]|nr:MAG: DNA-directed RNA polymerase subunit beta' [Parcubacteria bacterium DG_74_2]